MNSETKELKKTTDVGGLVEHDVRLPIQCPFCGASNIDLSKYRGFVNGDEARPTIAAGCDTCGAMGPIVEFDSITGYDESQQAWDKRAI